MMFELRCLRLGIGNRTPLDRFESFSKLHLTPQCVEFMSQHTNPLNNHIPLTNRAEQRITMVGLSTHVKTAVHLLADFHLQKTHHDSTTRKPRPSRPFRFYNFSTFLRLAFHPSFFFSALSVRLKMALATETTTCP